MSQSGKLTPNLDENSTKMLNLTVLQRVDPFVGEILLTAAHVTFYQFNIESNQWSRKDVEGSLFVVKRNAQPRFQFIVMNRRNTDNLVENLLGDFEFEIQVPYLLYRNASQEVNGIWFYDSRECEEVANLFSRILGAYAKVPAKSKVSPHSEFQELEAVSTLTVMDGPLEPSSTAGNRTNIPDDRAFINFFSNALNNEVTPNVAASPQPYFAPTTSISAPHPQTGPATQTPYNLYNISASSPVMSVLESNQNHNAAKHSTDLLNPSLFQPPVSSTSLITPPVSSSMPSAPPLNPPGGVHRGYGAPLLQPFPPPTPPPSLTPTVPAPNHGILTREKVRDSIQLLVQDDRFIDMVYRAVMTVHRS